MATRTRDSTPSTERRGRSPSTPQRRSPSTSNRSSPAKTRDSSSSTTTTKSVPNYLKPTISSGLDASKQQGKKPVLAETAANRLLRRRSFDKPPPPSHSPKTRVSPSPTLRSSSFSGKTVTSSKQVPDNRNLRVPREPGKQHSMYGASALKKTSSFAKKQGPRDVSTSSTKKERVSSPSQKSESSDVPDHLSEHDSHVDEKESVISEAEELTVQDESTGIAEDQVMKIEQKETDTENDASTNIKTEEALEIVETNRQQESKEVISDEKVASNFIQEADEKEEEEPMLLDTSVDEELREIEVKEVPEMELQLSVVEEHVSVENEEKEEKLETEKTVEPVEENKEESENTALEEKKETENAAPKQQMMYGRKESVVSNDVIEETASKLREQRKNKVKALAGAFESVISLQEPK